MWQIEYTDVAEAALMALEKPVRTRLLDYMRDRVAVSEDPTKLAEPLKGELRGLWRFRVGDYRIIADVHKQIEIVEVLDAGHRSIIYRKTGR